MFSKKFPAPALRCGADVVIQSLHKTLPCLTQASLLHVNSKRIDRNSLKRFLGIYQTSSPSYLLMASIDKCIRFMREESAPRMTEFTQLLAKFYHKSEALRRLKVFSPSSCPPESCFAHDFSKILISVGRTGLTGKELYDSLLQTYHLQMEMSSGHYVTALTSLMDTKEGLQRLIAALEDIDHKNRPAEYGEPEHLLTSELIYQTPDRKSVV